MDGSPTIRLNRMIPMKACGVLMLQANILRVIGRGGFPNSMSTRAL
jgi:hypothetical protein